MKRAPALRKPSNDCTIRLGTPWFSISVCPVAEDSTSSQKRNRYAPNVPILVLSSASEDQLGIRSIKAGAAGYLNKRSRPQRSRRRASQNPPWWTLHQPDSRRAARSGNFTSQQRRAPSLPVKPRTRSLPAPHSGCVTQGNRRRPLHQPQDCEHLSRASLPKAGRSERRGISELRPRPRPPHSLRPTAFRVRLSRVQSLRCRPTPTSEAVSILRVDGTSTN